MGSPRAVIGAAARVWADELGIEPADAWSFGDSEAMADELAALVVSASPATWSSSPGSTGRRSA